MVNQAVLPPDADLIAAYSEFAHSLTLPGFLARAAGTRRLQSRPASTWNTASASTSASPTSNADTSHHE
jgi:hypothetical protein